MMNAEFASIGNQLSRIRTHVVLNGKVARQAHSFMTALEELGASSDTFRPLLEAFHRAQKTEDFPVLGPDDLEASQKAVDKMLTDSSEYDTYTLTELLDEFINQAKPGSSLKQYIDDTRGKFAKEINQAMMQNRSELMLNFIEQLKDQGYFSEFPEDNPIVSHMLNGLLALNGTKTLDLETMGQNFYLAKLQSYRFDTIKKVLDGKLNQEHEFRSGDYASDPYIESLSHLKAALNRNPSLTFLAAFDILREEVVNQKLSPAKFVVKLGNLRSALNDS